MPCTDPRTVSFLEDGKTICWSQKKRSKQYAPFQLPCGQCLECRLDYARQWAVRCVHEAKMHPKNTFITLTYSDDKLTSPRLDYTDFQKFMKKLRKLQNEPMGVFVTGEYGEKNKRPHWHAIIFNYQFPDLEYLYTSDRGDRLFKSDTLEGLWARNDTKNRPNEIGEVTFHSAGYCARYAAKKLVHGKDQDHDFHPISKKSNKHAIGKKWLESHYKDVFNYGHIILPDGSQCSIPRYYERWLKENKPQEYLRYVTQVKTQKCDVAQRKADAEENKLRATRLARSYLTTQDGAFREAPTSRLQAKAIILKSKFKLLQEKLKL